MMVEVKTLSVRGLREQIRNVMDVTGRKSEGTHWRVVTGTFDCLCLIYYDDVCVLKIKWKTEHVLAYYGKVSDEVLNIIHEELTLRRFKLVAGI